MKHSQLETGILKIFRFFLIVQLILIYVSVFAHAGRGFSLACPECALIVGTGSTLFLLAYLSIPWLERKLGWFYLPVALLCSAVVSLVIQNTFLYFREPHAGFSSEENAWTLFLFLFIPMLLIGWQYSFKAVVLFCVFTAVLDHFLMIHNRPDFNQFSETYHRLIFVRTISFLIVGYIVSNIVGQLRQQRRALAEANLRLAHYASTLEQLAVSRERNRMARELHDTVAHTLSGLAVQLEAVKSLWDNDSPKAHNLLLKSLAATRSGLTETRKAIQALRATPLENLGISLALQEIAKSAAERAGLDLELEVAPDLGEIPASVEQCLYRVTQESFENIIYHAQAKHVRLLLARQNGRVLLTIYDDGIGFDPKMVDHEGHFGLRGMLERSEMIGGHLAVDSEIGAGTTVCFIWEAHD